MRYAQSGIRSVLPDAHRCRVNSTLCVGGHEVQSFWAGPMLGAKGHLDDRSAVEHQSQVTRIVELGGDDLASDLATYPFGAAGLRKSPTLTVERPGGASEEPNNRVSMRSST